MTGDGPWQAAIGRELQLREPIMRAAALIGCRAALVEEQVRSTGHDLFLAHLRRTAVVERVPARRHGILAEGCHRHRQAAREKVAIGRITVWRIILDGKVLQPACPCWQQPVHSDYGEYAGVLLSSVIYTVSIPCIRA